MLPKAPPLSGTDWLNTDPLSTERLLGRPVVLLFWTSTCEGSWVRLRQLEELGRRHGDHLRVIAVHSPRFDFERDLDALAGAVTTRSVEIPVLHDPHLDTWARYGPIGRPTIVVLDHRLRVVGAMAGTDARSIEALEQIVDEQVAVARASQPVPRRNGNRPPKEPDDRVPERRPLHQLHGPASAARLNDGRVVVADRGNGRLLALDLDPQMSAAQVSSVFGGLHGIGHLAARRDGRVAVSFPDRGAVDTIDIDSKRRTSLARGMLRPTGMVEDRDGSLVVADGGADQLIRITDEQIAPIAGTDKLPLSQPLDVIRIEAGLAFVEASTGAIRLLTDRGKIHTLNDGSRAGLADGPVHRALFQRPTGLATLDDGSVAIADHGNHRVRLLHQRKVTTVPVAGLRRPEGLLYLGRGKLLCCDTGNDRLVVIDLVDQSVDELMLDGLPL